MSTAQVVVRLERVNVTDGPGANRMLSPLLTSMYLGDRWEYLFESGDLRLRAFGHELREPGTEHWVELPAQACWAYAG